MTHVVVVGSGIAGITAALHAAASCEVTLVTKAGLDAANTTFAQGGIAAALSEGDSPAAHAHDTLAAGADLGDRAAVDVLTREAPARIGELVGRGVAFDRDDAGVLARGLEAAHAHARVVHAGGDATGWEIERALIAALRASAVHVIEHAFLVDLVVARRVGAPAPARVTGVELLIHGERRVVAADAVILATGGAGQLYAHTTNPGVATGDGIAAAMRAGAAVADLEFVQFHPTVLAAGDPFLISEAVRGEGAVIVDDDGRRFLFDAHPDGELAPRDVVARAIARRMNEQGGRPVRLDATRLGEGDGEGDVDGDGDAAVFLAHRFPTIDAAVRARGLDWARAPIPVTPAAHYLMGGIVTELHGRTSLPGLYAVGECARTGVHGANRLASNSLLEGAVFGARAGDAVARDAASACWSATWAGTPCSVPSTGHTSAGRPPSRAALQQLMWQHVGLERDAAGLAHAAERLAGWAAAPRDLHEPHAPHAPGQAAVPHALVKPDAPHAPVEPHEPGQAAVPHEPHAPRTVAEHEDANLLLLARAVVAAATARTASIGAHFRADDDDAPVRTQPIRALRAPQRAQTAGFRTDWLSSARDPAPTIAQEAS
ncbi:L-aspartate oxidase [Microbacterium sp.]|uniref:L-aspartate oxidase n=1 Tax=Microbacterium sp. TaxID=51671 RepID=UPI003A93A3CC